MVVIRHDRLKIPDKAFVWIFQLQPVFILPEADSYCHEYQYGYIMPVAFDAMLPVS